MASESRQADVLDTPEAGGLVVRGGAARALGFVVGTLIALVGVVLLTRHLGVATFGRYQTVISIVTIVGVVTDLGMTALGVREYVQRHGEDRERLMRVLLGLRITLTLGGVALGAVFAALAGYPMEMVAGVGLMGLGLIVLVVQTTLQIPMAAELRLGTVATIDVGRQALQAGLIALLVAAGAGLLPFLALTIPVHVVLVAWTAVLVRGAVSLRPSFAFDEWLELAKPAFALALAVAVGVIYLYTAQILTSLVSTERETGLFSAAFRVFAIIAGVPALLVAGALPLLSRAAVDDRARLVNAVRGLFAAMLLLGGAAAVVLVAGAGPIISVVAGPGFEPAADVLRVQGGALLLTFVAATWGFTLLAEHRHRAMVFANLAALATSLVTVGLLASSSGALGAAFGTLLGEAVLAGGYLLALIRIQRDLAPSAGQAARVALALAAAAACLALPLPAVALTVVALLAYAVVAYAAGAVPAELIAQLPPPLRRLLA